MSAAIYAIFFCAAYAHAESRRTTWQDFTEKFSLQYVGEKINSKLHEHILNEPVYFQLSTANRFRVMHPDRAHLQHTREQEEFIEDLLRDVSVDALQYGIERSVRDMKLYRIIKRGIRGMLSAHVDKPQNQEIEIEPPSYKRPLDPFYESRSELEFECKNISGQSERAERLRAWCFRERVRIKRREEKDYDFRFRPGIDVESNIDGDLNVAPVIEPFVEAHFFTFDAILSYAYSLTLRNRNGDDNEHSSGQAKLDLDQIVITENLSVEGGYRFNPSSGKSTVKFTPIFSHYPYFATINALVEVGDVTPRLTASMKRSWYNIVFELKSTARKKQNKEWRYKSILQASFIW